MRRSIFNRYLSDQTAAIAPLFALVIPALVVMGAIGFDYGRLMALDTELQNAADQAALAAATQLDGGDDAMIRARDAANNTFASSGSQFTNETRFANDGQGRPITSLSFEFYDGYADDTPGAEVEDDVDGAGAKVVQVTVNARQVFYALTPLVGAINSGDVIGRAMATIQNATCNVPPMMFCVPQIDHDNNPLTPPIADTTFPGGDDVGKGLKLHFKTNGDADCNGQGCGKNDTDTDVWAPGNFGFLDIDYGITGNDKVRTVGLNSDFLGCAGEAVESDPGFRTPQGAALNTRFDLYSAPINNPNACDGDGNYCPGTNTRKDHTVTETKVIRQKTTLPTPATPNCGDYDTRSDYVPNTAAKNFTQDSCFANSSCGSSILGTGPWDYATYLDAHHPGATAADFGKTSLSEVTRFDVYSWELEDPANRLRPERISSSSTVTTQGANSNYTFTNICSYPTPIKAAPGLTPSETQKDRRVLTVAAVDCTNLNGSEEVKILRWADLFLVRPVNTTASDRNFFAEIVGPAKQANGDSGFQYYGRKKAVLIR